MKPDPALSQSYKVYEILGLSQVIPEYTIENVLPRDVIFPWNSEDPPIGIPDGLGTHVMIDVENVGRNLGERYLVGNLTRAIYFVQGTLF